MATKSVTWNDGSGDYITLTYAGQGDGTISVVSDANNGSARSQTITIQTTKGGLVTKNVTVSQAACPFPVGDIKNFSYTGTYQEIELPAGQYKLQCWGAQGGSNGANSSYGITAKAGGKGGYSEGIITLSQATTFRVYVGGQGNSSAGGFNGGGNTTGTSQYSAGGEFGYSKMGGGGGATDIRLSDGALLSRMIVAGGGSGGAMAYKQTTSTTSEKVTSFTSDGLYYSSGAGYWYPISWTTGRDEAYIDVSQYQGGSFTFNANASQDSYYYFTKNKPQSEVAVQLASASNGWTPSSKFMGIDAGKSVSGTVPSDANYMCVFLQFGSVNRTPRSVVLSKTTTSSTTSSQVGYVGGGTSGGGYSDAYKGTQNAAGHNGSFGQGADAPALYVRYCSGAGGGGWYGGGEHHLDSDITIVQRSGGGSGFVNTAASAGNRPSGYTGLQLDSGSTTAGSSSFPAPGGGNETGHSGNGYARITRLS